MGLDSGRYVVALFLAPICVTYMVWSVVRGDGATFHVNDSKPLALGRCELSNQDKRCSRLQVQLACVADGVQLTVVGHNSGCVKSGARTITIKPGEKCTLKDGDSFFLIKGLSESAFNIRRS